MSELERRYEQMIEHLKNSGRRITSQRMAIVRELAESKGHPTVEQIRARLLTRFPTLGLATVYKTVALLKSQGELLELCFSDLGSRYDGRRPYPHPHVICSGCGEVLDPEGLDTAQALQRITAETGYRILSHRLDFFGICPACQTREQEAPATATEHNPHDIH